MEQRGHLIDEGARAAGTGLVHAQIDAASEIKNLRVLAAEFNGDVCLGGQLGNAARGGDDFLNEREAEGAGQVKGCRAGNGAMDGDAGEMFFKVLENGEEHLARGRAVTLVAGIERIACGIQEHSLDCNRADINAQITVIRHSFLNAPERADCSGAEKTAGSVRGAGDLRVRTDKNRENSALPCRLSEKNDGQFFIYVKQEGKLGKRGKRGTHGKVCRERELKMQDFSGIEKKRQGS